MNAEYSYEYVVLDALKRAVAEALDRKRRLGQYAVIWRDGKVMRLDPDGTEIPFPPLDQSEAAPDIAEPGKK